MYDTSDRELLHHLSREVGRLGQMILILIRRDASQEKHIMTQIEELTASVHAQTDVITSATTLLAGLHAQLVAAGTDPVKLAEIANTLQSNTTALAAAVAANTDPAPATT
jgi:hypothetical protein